MDVKLDHFNMIVPMNDVERLILLRKQLGGIKQYELAQLLEVNSNYLSDVETYQRPFTNSLKRKINRFLEERQNSL